jgi:hypothetical protein
MHRYAREEYTHFGRSGRRPPVGSCASHTDRSCRRASGQLSQQPGCRADRRFPFVLRSRSVTFLGESSSGDHRPVRLAAVTARRSCCQQLRVTGRRPRRRPRRYRWRAGRGCRGPGRIASWCADPNARPPLAHRAAAPRHPNCGDGRASERVRADFLGDPGPVCDAADDHAALPILSGRAALSSLVLAGAVQAAWARRGRLGAACAGRCHRGASAPRRRNQR